MQTRKIDHFPIILFGSEYWSGLLEWLRSTVATDAKVDAGDLDLVRVCDDVDEVVSIIAAAYAQREANGADRDGDEI